jgi:hypothetical protein
MILVAHFDLELHQIDVKTTFLNEDFKDEVYTRQPKGFINNNQNACKLKKKNLFGGILFTRLLLHFLLKTLLISIYTLRSVGVK